MRILCQSTRLPSDVLEVTARALLEAMVPLARFQVANLPPLYRAGVEYREEQDGETFVDPLTVHARKWGDCAHLSLWAVASLRNKGRDATFRIRRIIERPDGSRLFHVTVRCDGKEIDPSAKLGM